MGNECCRQNSTSHEIVRTKSGKIVNRFVRKQRKFRTGLHVEKTSEMGAEANFQAAYTTDVEEKYSKVNGNGCSIPKVLDLVAAETQTEQSKQIHLNNEK